MDKNFFVLKEGCNLRFFYKSIRYSEDIDLDTRIIAKHTLENKISNLLQSNAFTQILRSKNLELINISSPKQTETTQRWKLSLRTQGSLLPLPTKIEFSRRNKLENISFNPIDVDLIRQYQLYPIMSNHYSLQAAFNQKVDALIHRTQVQARDIFDIKLLLDQGAIAKKLPSNLKKNIETANANILQIQFAEFKSQVVAYLMEQYQEYYNSAKIWHDLQIEVLNALEDVSV